MMLARVFLIATLFAAISGARVRPRGWLLRAPSEFPPQEPLLSDATGTQAGPSLAGAVLGLNPLALTARATAGSRRRRRNECCPANVYPRRGARSLAGAFSARVSLELTSVADKGSSADCNGEDWIRFANSGSDSVNLEGFMLTDDKGRDDGDAFTFAAGASIAAGETMLMCKDAEGSFAFKIGGDDTITLWDGDGKAIDTTTLLDEENVFDRVWTWDVNASAWGYVAAAAETKVAEQKAAADALAREEKAPP